MSNSDPRRPIVFLDRDGTISDDRGYTCTPEAMRIFPGSGHAIAALKAAGFRVVIVTNQSAIGRGYATREQVHATNTECLRQLSAENVSAQIDLVRVCPHLPEDGCACRKPLPGMVRSPDFPYPFEPNDGWVVGDKLIDLEFGLALGLPPSHCLLVRTGEGSAECAKLETNERLLPFSSRTVFASLEDAVGHIVARQADMVHGRGSGNSRTCRTEDEP